VALTDECARLPSQIGVCWRRWAAEVGTTDPEKPRPEQACSACARPRTVCNLRPVKPLPALYDASPLRRERIEGTDLLVVRELTGASTSGRRRARTSASTCAHYTTEEIDASPYGLHAAERRSSARSLKR